MYLTLKSRIASSRVIMPPVLLSKYLRGSLIDSGTMEKAAKWTTALMSSLMKIWSKKARSRMSPM